MSALNLISLSGTSVLSELYGQPLIVITLFFVVMTLFFERTIALMTAKGKEQLRLWSWGRVVSKSCASLSFLLYFYVMSPSPPLNDHEVHTQTLWLALGASALGDVLLLGSRDRDFLAGLISFFIAHLAFAYAFMAPLSSRLLEFNVALCALALLVILSALSVIIYRSLRPYIVEDLRLPALAYTLVISLMVAAAFLHSIYLACPLIAVGAIAFWLSDLAVAKQQFQGPDLPLGGLYVRYWGLPLYYIAQLILGSEGQRFLGWL